MSYCNWDKSSYENINYHDTEWGIPVHSDYKHFEFLMLEIMQCGLNWNLIVRKRKIFQKCFDGFDYDKIAKYEENDIKRILNVSGMIKSHRKIMAIIHNAYIFQRIRREYGSFDNYLWRYSKGKTILYERHNQGYIPSSNDLSNIISKDLKKSGFKFVGPVIVYSYLQACGIINDHDENCPRYRYILENFPITYKKRTSEKGVNYFG